MLASILATLCAVAVPPVAPAATGPDTVAVAVDDKPIKALSAWLKKYRSGKINIYSTEYRRRVPVLIDWRHQEITAKQSFAVKYGLAPKVGLADSTWLGDLEVIAAAVAKLDNPAAAAGLVDLASVGLDRREYEREQAPHLVRGQGEKWIARLADPAARAEVARIASGQVKLDKSRAVALQGAALRGLAAFGDAEFRGAIEPALAHGDAFLRFHAAEALARLADEASARALISALESESSEVALPAIADALRAVYARYLPKLGAAAGERTKGEDAAEPDAEAAGKPGPKPAAKATPEGASESAPDTPSESPEKKALPESSRLAVRAALQAIGRTSWRGDMALLRLLDDLRTLESIPALIGILEKFESNPDLVRSGKLSTLVKHRAHELLVTMTGAVFPASQPEKWRELWEREKDKIDVRQRHASTGSATTVASGFCGIPVEGSRVIFILDLSRSMTFAMDREPGSTRMDYARRQLRAAMGTIADNASFNLITFDGNENAEVWNKKLVPATARNREKFNKYVAKLEPDGGTNLWSALEVALKIKSMTYGDRYETNVDEIFILSDGAPSVGEVVDPIEILRLVKEANRFSKMRINTIFINSKDPEEERRRNPMPWMGRVKPEELMRRLAEENGGKCVIL